MIEREYATSNTHAQQTLSIVINAPADKVFTYYRRQKGFRAGSQNYLLMRIKKFCLIWEMAHLSE